MHTITKDSSGNPVHNDTVEDGAAVPSAGADNDAGGSAPAGEAPADAAVPAKGKGKKQNSAADV